MLSCGPCRRARLPRGWPPSPPSAKALAGGSADLMNFYATSYAVAYGRGSRRRPRRLRGGSFPGLSPLSPLSPRPAAVPSPPGPPHRHRLRVQQRLGRLPPALPARRSGRVGSPAVVGTGGKFWGHSVTAMLASRRSHCQDRATSTTAEHFKPFWLPDGRSLLPRHVHQPGSGYLQESSSLSCLRTGAVSPQHTWHRQGPPQSIQGVWPQRPPRRSCPVRYGFGGAGGPRASSDPRRFWGIGGHRASSDPRRFWGISGHRASSDPRRFWGIGGHRASSDPRRFWGIGGHRASSDPRRFWGIGGHRASSDPRRFWGIGGHRASSDPRRFWGIGGHRASSDPRRFWGIGGHRASSDPRRFWGIGGHRAGSGPRRFWGWQRCPALCHPSLPTPKHRGTGRVPRLYPTP
ncbi:stabilizer of axonemal microtubules 4 [Theristicus caerulescens]